MITKDGTIIERRATTADLEVGGLQNGILIAKELIRLGFAHIGGPLLELAIATCKHTTVDAFVSEQRATNGLTLAGEQAYRRGFDRGLASQLKYPKAKIDVQAVKAA